MKSVIAKYRDLSFRADQLFASGLLACRKGGLMGQGAKRDTETQSATTITKAGSKLGARVHTPRLCMPRGRGTPI